MVKRLRSVGLLILILILVLGVTSCAGIWGPQGPEDPQGPRGTQGSRGETGLQGPQGEKGLKGDRGDKGARGAQGEEGPEGKRGYQGSTGLKGDKGERGPQGIPGDNLIVAMGSVLHQLEGKASLANYYNVSELLWKEKLYIIGFSTFNYDNQWEYVVSVTPLDENILGKVSIPVTFVHPDYPGRLIVVLYDDSGAKTRGSFQFIVFRYP